MTAHVCATCGAQFPPADNPPPACPVCDDERQYVPEDGQRWTSLTELLDEGHLCRLDEEGELVGVGSEPSFAIGQRALLVPFGDTNLMWDCLAMIDDAAVDEITRRGGVGAIAISHPHYYTGMVEWAKRLDCPVLLHADDSEWIMRPDPVVELWEGESKQLGSGLTLLRCGGHFAGGTVLHWAGGAGGRGALLSGDIVQVIPDRRHVGFMYSYPNLIPLPPAAVERIARTLEPYPFDVIYGAWWGRVVREDGSAVVRRSAERYVRAVGG